MRAGRRGRCCWIAAMWRCRRSPRCGCRGDGSRPRGGRSREIGCRILPDRWCSAPRGCGRCCASGEARTGTRRPFFLKVVSLVSALWYDKCCVVTEDESLADVRIESDVLGNGKLGTKTRPRDMTAREQCVDSSRRKPLCGLHCVFQLPGRGFVSFSLLTSNRHFV